MQDSAQQEIWQRDVLDSMLEGCQIIDFDWRYLYLNDIAERHARKRREELIGRRVMDIYPGIDNTAMFQTLSRCMQERTAADLVNEFTYPDSAPAWFQLHVQPVPEGLVIMSLDITRSRQAEENIHRLNRVYAVLSDVNQALIRITNETELFQSICDIAVRLGGFRLAWIGMHDAEHKVLLPKATAGQSADMVRRITFSLDPSTPEGHALACEAFRQGVTLVRNDYRADGERSYWHQQPLASGVVSVISLPLRRRGQVVGVFSLGSPELRYFDTETIGLLEEMAEDISFSLDKLDQAKEFRETLMALLESRDALQTTIETSPQPIIVTDPQGAVTLWNKAAEQVFGWSAAQTIYLYFAPQFQEASQERARRHSLGLSTPAEYEVVGQRLDGSQFPMHVEVADVMLADGPASIAFVTDVTERKRAEEDVRQSYIRLRETLRAAIDSLASAIESRDPYTAGHQERVARLACAIARDMGLDGEMIEGIEIAGLIHDVGKLGVPGEILSKPARLTDVEYALVKAHSEIGYTILSKIEFPWPIAQIVYQHHERMNGTGYPQGLLGKDILLQARILAVADVVEAMSSYRPYRAALGIQAALQEIAQRRGVAYDPEVAGICLQLFADHRFTFD